MTELTPKQLHIERLELRIALGGRSAERAQRELDELLKEDSDPEQPHGYWEKGDY